MTTAFHLQTDGQAEKANAIVEICLWTVAAGNERHWYRLLALAEFSYNAHTHKTTNRGRPEREPANAARCHGSSRKEIRL